MFLVHVPPACFDCAPQHEVKLWRHISHVLLTGTADPFLHSLYNHSARPAHTAASRALSEAAAAHKEVRAGLAQDLGKGFLAVVRHLFDMRHQMVGNVLGAVHAMHEGCHMGQPAACFSTKPVCKG